ncbi:MAG: efflux RND transporter periplasmic adaptor subunit [Saccharospirillum sp.]
MKAFLLTSVRLLIALSVPAAAIAVAIFMSQNHSDETAMDTQDPRMPVAVLAVAPGDYQPIAHWTGQVEARRQVTLTAPVSTEVVTIAVREGQTVQAGDTLIRLDTQSLRWDLERTEADLAEFDANIRMTRNQQRADADLLALEESLLEQVEASLERQLGLLQRGVTTEEAVEQNRASVTQARQAVRQRRLAIDNHPATLISLQAQRDRLNIALERQRDALSRAEPVAPFAGRIGRISVVEGQNVQAGQALITLYQPQSLAWRVVMPMTAPDTLVADILGQHMPLIERSDLIGAGESGHRGWFQVPAQADWSPGETRSNRVIWPVRSGVQPIPRQALYSGNRVFLVDDDQRLGSVVVEVVGVVEHDGDEQWLIDTTGLPADGRILATQLANILPGMAVSVVNETTAGQAAGEVAQ